MNIPDEDVDLNAWKAKHADHFASREHVSKSKFAAFHGSKDHGCKLHIPAGAERVQMNLRDEKAAQKIRCAKLRNEKPSQAS